MDAGSFPITTGYGQVPGYPLNNGWHKGEDRAMPMYTPVLVNGIEIGLSGNTGATIGPHLHIGRFVGGGDVNPSRGGFDFINARVTEVGEDARNGKFVRIQGDGASWVYLHLSRQSVSVGQVLVRPVSAPPATPASYSVVENYPNGKQIQLNKDTSLWGMNYHFDFMVSHPVETGHRQGEIWTVTNKVHHENGYDYYRREGQVDGFNVLDCNDYTPPPPPPPPAAPVAYKPAETYTLEVPVMSFETASGALHHSGLSKTLEKGKYFVYGNRSKDMINLTDNNQKDRNWWINPQDNVVAVIPEPTPATVPTIAPLEVVPTPVPELVIAPTIAPEPDVKQETKDMATDWRKCTPLKTDAQGRWQPVKYRSTNAMAKQIGSLDGNMPANITLPARKTLNLVCTFLYDGEVYARDDLLTKTHRYYALPFDMFEKVEEPVRAMDRDQDGDVDIHDYIDYISDVFKPVFTKTVDVIKTNKPKRFIDGIIAANRKDRTK